MACRQGRDQSCQVLPAPMAAMNRPASTGLSTVGPDAWTIAEQC